ncbi:hypothetical protein HY484_00070 [Candidatus Woesearchaeota archaeon]|nr:hypothetical protein [Candidatus Woesearchaeota archaeon]
MLVLTACAQESISAEQESFKELCNREGHGWMKMSETKNGMITGLACDGCMPDAKNHLCDQKEYGEYVKK